jgi:hypothetical protein
MLTFGYVPVKSMQARARPGSASPEAAGENLSMRIDRMVNPVRNRTRVCCSGKLFRR